MQLISIFYLVFSAVSILGAPTTRDASPTRYIVILKDGVANAQTDSLISNLATGSEITHKWNSLVNGFAGPITESNLEALRKSESVASVEKDRTASISSVQSPTTWGLGRISSKTTLADQNPQHFTNFSYNYDSRGGSGVDIYSIDTGIYTSHPAFEGRARWGKTFGPYGDHDFNGHGTHTAGTAASGQYGVAKAANLIAVKVLGDNGDGLISDIISGLEWVKNEASVSGRPSIASMAISTELSDALDAAAMALVEAGVTVVASAGNNNSDGGSRSPAHLDAVISVGATDISDRRMHSSNYGPSVDIFAPGQDILSAWQSVTATLSGTSMACAHVSGLMAYFMAGNNVSPAAARSIIQSYALAGVITDIPVGTPNLLANNRYLDPASRDQK